MLRRNGILVLLMLILAPAGLAQTIAERLNEAFALFDAGKTDQARERFEAILARALETNNPLAEAEARRGLGGVLNRGANYAEARAQLERALALHQSISQRSGVGLAYVGLGYTEWAQGNLSKAGDYYRLALVEFDAVGNVQQKATILYNLTFIETNPEREFSLIQEGLTLSRRIGDRLREALLLHAWSDKLFAEGKYAEAIEKLEPAIAIFEQEHAAVDLGRALTSAGRLYRAHGAHERSLEFYRRSLELHEASGDRVATIQSLNAIAVGLSYLGKHRESLRYQERALQIAEATGSKTLARELARVGNRYVNIGNYERARELLERAVQESEYREIPYFLARVYLVLKRYSGALKMADEALRLAQGSDEAFRILWLRAAIRSESGDRNGAVGDVQHGLRILEETRGNASPLDVLKRGFADQHSGFFAFAVEALHNAGRHLEALEIAEAARGRAFIDLLASREIEPKEKDRAQLAALRALDDQLSGKPDSTDQNQLWNQWRNSDAELRSMVSVEPMSAAQIRATLTRLESTLIAYWVNQDHTFIWAFRPNGHIKTVRVNVTKSRLTALVAGARSGLSQPQERAKPSRALTVRGGDAVVELSNVQLKAWRDLYDLLIRPVEQALPRSTDSLLTIVPHGPLFQLSFAALIDNQSRYLIERYRLHYAPSVSALELTKSKAGKLDSPRYLAIADPARMPAALNGKPLPSLPGSRKEASAITELQPDRVKVVAGADATEQGVRSALSSGSIVHFATHGILRSDQPFESFLALGRTGAAESEDGRLTAREIYQLDLNAELVVLSACRSGLGEISSDGIIGLTRAFFYAGTASVMGTVWDVADEPTARLISDFYRAYARTSGKSSSLRDAQLRLIRALRAGQVKAATPMGEVSLPEHPLFWAGFLLFGEP